MDAQEALKLLKECEHFATGDRMKLVRVVQWLVEELGTLKAINESLTARVAAQSELLSRKAERPGDYRTTDPKEW